MIEILKGKTVIFAESSNKSTTMAMKFNQLWNATVISTTLVFYILNVFLILCEFPRTQLTAHMLTGCDVILISDIVVSLVKMKCSLRTLYRSYDKLHLFLLVCNVLSAFETILKQFDDVLEPIVTTEVATILVVMYSLRCFNLLRLNALIGRSIGMGFHNVLLGKLALFYVVFVHTCGGIWLQIKPTAVTRWAWTKGLLEVYKPNTTLQWYGISTYFMATATTRVGFGDIIPATDAERILTLIVIVCGYGFFVGYAAGSWTSAQVEVNRRLQLFNIRLKIIYDDLMSRDVRPMVINRVLKFYANFWERKRGVTRSNLLVIFPQTITREVKMDKYKIFFKKCKIFSKFQEAIIRELSLKMKTVLFLENEIIWKKNSFTRDVFFVHSGIIKILQNINSLCVTAVLTQGSLLNESCFFLNKTHTSYAVAGSYCEVYTCSKADFWRVLASHAAMMKTIVWDHFEEIRNDCARNQEKLKLSVKDSQQDLFEYNPKSALHQTKLHNNYVAYDEIAVQEPHDFLFRTHWPYIFNLESNLKSFIDVTIAAITLINGIILPYYSLFLQEISSWDERLIWSMDVMYWVDFYVESCTVFKSGKEIEMKLRSILWERAKTLTFWVHLIAIFPKVVCFKLVGKMLDERIVDVLYLTRLLLFFKVWRIFKKLESNFLIQRTSLACLRYVLMLLFLGYWTGAIIYATACFYECRKDSWIMVNSEYLKLNDSMPLTVITSIYSAIAILSQAGYGDFQVTNDHEIIVEHLLFIVGVVFLTYMIADYSAIIILDDMDKLSYRETVDVMKKYLTHNKISRSIRRRVYTFLSLQWRYQKGHNLTNREVMFDAPTYLKQASQTQTCIEAVKSVLGLKRIADDDIRRLVGEARKFILPPNEIVIYAGEKCRHFYVIEEGYVEVKFKNPESSAKVLLGPKSTFSVLEAALNHVHLQTIVTYTYVKILRVGTDDLRKVLYKYPSLYLKLSICCQQTKESSDVQRLTSQLEDEPFNEQLPARKIKSKRHSAWFVFPKNEEYVDPFENVFYGPILKYFLMTRTLYSDSKFLVRWEIQRIIFAFIASMTYPILFLFPLNTPMRIVTILCDVLAVLDIYLRFHVTYFNAHGILVTHPLYTCKNYARKSFVIDLLAVAPLLEIAGVWTDNSVFPITLLRLNKTIQMYRFPSVFQYYRANILHRPRVWFMFSFVFVVLVVFNIATTVILAKSIGVVTFANGTVRVSSVRKASWVTHAMDYDFDWREPINVYLIGLNWVSTVIMLCPFGDTKPYTGGIMILLIIFTITGYLLFTYIIVRFSSSQANNDLYLAIFKNKLEYFLQFLKNEGVSTGILRQTSAYFEYVYSKTRDHDPTKFLKKCNIALRQDASLNLFERTFLKVSVFENAPKSFFRQLGILVKETYWLPDTGVLDVNFIVEDLFIVHRGKILVYGPEKSFMGELCCGSIFGNLDDIKHIRNTYTFRTKTKVDLLVIRTEEFYRLVKDFPTIQRRMNWEILSQNTTFFPSLCVNSENISENEWKETDQIKYPHENVIKFTNVKRDSVEWIGFPSLFDPKLITCILALITVFSSPYHFAFQVHTTPMYLIVYIVDGGFVLFKYVLGTKWFHHNVSNPSNSSFVSRLLTFTINLMIDAPFELIFLALNDNESEMLFNLTLVRLIKISRIAVVVNHFKVTHDQLHVNITFAKIVRVSVYLITAVHLITCSWWAMGCPRNECSEHGWTYQQRGVTLVHMCKNSYVCALYSTIVTVSFTCFGDISPRTKPEIVFTLVVLLMAHYAVAYFLSEMTAAIQMNSTRFVTYNNEMLIVKDYLDINSISQRVKARTMGYGVNLWEKERGVQEPVLFAQVPVCLLMAIYGEIYLKHISKSYLFSKTHVHFKQQLVLKLKRLVFFDGDIILKKGDVVGAMYFIHRGRVKVSDGHKPSIVGENSSPNCFNEIQGVKNKYEALFTYVSLGHTVILSLKHSDWTFLEVFFPASQRVIQERCDKLIGTAADYYNSSF